MFATNSGCACMGTLPRSRDSYLAMESLFLFWLSMQIVFDITETNGKSVGRFLACNTRLSSHISSHCLTCPH